MWKRLCVKIKGLSKNCYSQREYCSSNRVNYQHTLQVPKSPFLPVVNLGQPTPETHPHLLRPGEVTPGISRTEYKERRLKLLQSVQKYSVDSKSHSRNHIIIIPSAMKKYMSDKIPYIFRQNSDFFYLTGCLEPDTILLLEVNDKEETISSLFMRPKDKNAELWDGPRTGPTYALKFFGVEQAYDSALFAKLLRDKVSNITTPLSVWYDCKNNAQPNLNEIIERYTKNQFNDPTPFLQTLRLIKSNAEMNLMRKTCYIASKSLNETMQETKVGDSEHHIFARMDYKCRMRNASYLAYPPVVASGNNCTTIHYINNSQLTKNGDLILMDAGCEYGGYTSDITRTWPVNGVFNSEQKILYDVLETLQDDLLKTILNEGGETLDQLFDTMCLKLGKYLQEIGLIPESFEKTTLARAAYKFCPHHVSHYLGMDVHDTPLMSRKAKLVPGMVCTVEPGIYISHDRNDVPKNFRGLGIRIEDDILVKTESEIEILTASCIKNRNEIENLIQFRNQEIQ